MRKVIAFIVVLWAAIGVRAAEFDPFEGPKPLLVFIQTDPWAMVIGADTPRVAVYESGEVVFTKKAAGWVTYHHITLGKEELDQVRARLKPVLAVKDLKPQYDVRPNATDQPEAQFYLRDGDREVATSVYGLKSADTKLPGSTEFPNGPKPTVPPEELLKLHEWLVGLDYADSKPWTPKYVEVILWDYAHARDESIAWPKEWPALDSDRTIKRGESYSIFLDGDLVQKVVAFLATRKARGAVEIEGKKMSAAFRYTFPGERTWRKALAAAADGAEQPAQD